MKKIANYLLPAICLVAIVFSVAAFNKAGAATTVAGQNPAYRATAFFFYFVQGIVVGI